MKTKLKIKGMSCHHCEMKVSKALSEVEGIDILKVSAKKGEAIIKTQNPIDNALLNLISEKIKDAGYELKILKQI